MRAPVDGEAFLVGRTAERMRSEIRVRFGFREATIADADALKEGGKDQTLEKENWKVVYDKNELRPSHLISTFMKTLGHAGRWCSCRMAVRMSAGCKSICIPLASI